MALEYTLDIAGPTQMDVLEATLRSVPGYQVDSKGIRSYGLQVHIGRPGRLGREMIAEEFGFMPTASITFRLDKEAEPVAARASLLRGCVALLKDGNNDAVLLFNGETAILLRRKRALLLNPVEGFWIDEVLSIIPPPYYFESIRNI